MTVVTIVVLVGGALAALALGVVLVQIALLGPAEPTDPGSWRTQEPVATKPASPPRRYLALRSAEYAQWSRSASEWERLVRHLDQLEAELGGTPRPGPAPLVFTPEWLDGRLRQLEQLAGRLPGDRHPSRPRSSTRGRTP